MKQIFKDSITRYSLIKNDIDMELVNYLSNRFIDFSDRGFVVDVNVYVNIKSFLRDMNLYDVKDWVTSLRRVYHSRLSDCDNGSHLDTLDSNIFKAYKSNGLIYSVYLSKREEIDDDDVEYLFNYSNNIISKLSKVSLITKVNPVFPIDTIKDMVYPTMKLHFRKS